MPEGSLTVLRCKTCNGDNQLGETGNAMVLHLSGCEKSEIERIPVIERSAFDGLVKLKLEAEDLAIRLGRRAETLDKQLARERSAVEGLVEAAEQHQAWMDERFKEGELMPNEPDQKLYAALSAYHRRESEDE